MGALESLTNPPEQPWASGPPDVQRIVEEASQLRHVNEQLKSLDRMKDDFMSSVTHELRTPLTSIRALTELMQDDPEMEGAQRQQFLGIVVGETERLSRLVNQVLDMAKIESGQGDWRNDEIDLRGLVAQAVQTTARLFAERGARVELDAPAADTLLPRLRADRDRLLQVLINLLSNAAKFVPEGRGEVTVRLRADDRARPLPRPADQRTGQGRRGHGRQIVGVDGVDEGGGDPHPTIGQGRRFDHVPGAILANADQRAAIAQGGRADAGEAGARAGAQELSLIHISEPTRPY